MELFILLFIIVPMKVPKLKDSLFRKIAFVCIPITFKFDIKIMWRPMLCIVVVCILINLLLKNLIKFNNTIVDIKYEVQKLNEGINALRLKLVFYFLISFAISGFGWILVCSFCTIYSNSIKPLLIMAGLSLGATFIFQILFCILISSLRACSLNRTKKNCKYLYSFSNILTYL